MIDKIKQFFWDNAVLRWVINACSWAKNYALYQLQFAAASSARSKDPAYSQIAQFKDLHKGERCFILATGPSLTAQDVQKLEHEYTFGMNSICLLFDTLGWETTYYGIQDYGVYEKLQDKLRQMKDTTLFIGDGIPHTQCENICHIPYALNYLDHKHSYKHLNTRFSTDASKCVYDGYTITYSLMQLAVYMGFKEIYLLGNDCSYPKDPKKQHFMDYGHTDSSTLTARDRIIFAYEQAREFLKDTDVHIYNATRGGALEVFPRVDFDSIDFKKVE